MASMFIVHEDGHVDSVRVEPEEFLKYAEYCTNLASQLWHSYHEWQKKEASVSKKPKKDAPANHKDAPVQMGLELEP